MLWEAVQVDTGRNSQCLVHIPLALPPCGSSRRLSLQQEEGTGLPLCEGQARSVPGSSPSRGADETRMMKTTALSLRCGSPVGGALWAPPLLCVTFPSSYQSSGDHTLPAK